jgi:DNA-binding SARP family transcriptional activator
MRHLVQSSVNHQSDHPATIQIARAKTPRVTAKWDPAKAPPLLEIGPESCQLHLLGGFELLVGQHMVSLTSGMKRLLALLALRRKGVTRGYMAGVLWGDVSEARAQGSLRSNLSKLRGTGLDLIETSGDTLELASNIYVDLYEATRAANAIIDSDQNSEIFNDGRLLLQPHMNSELLPGWYDEWVLPDREWHRQLTLHALEQLCESLTTEQRYATAVMAGLAAIDQEPLRESAHRVLIKAHLAEENTGEALRCYNRYKGLAATELGLDPSPSMKALLSGVGGL